MGPEQPVWQHLLMDVEMLEAERLRFRDGAPVRAASAVVPFGDGHLVVSDDATRCGLVPGGDGHSRPAPPAGRRA